MSARIYLAAIEDSADALGAEVMQKLRATDPAVELSGLGGTRMREEGAVSDVDTSELAILGLFDGLRLFGRIKTIVAMIADDIARIDPDVVVLIDSWGLMWRIAREVRKRGLRCKTVKLIGPQVWATRPGRAKVLARWCDHLLCMHEFERPFYADTKLPVTVVGNPAIGRAPKGAGNAFRGKYGILSTQQILGLLPGSRTSELRRVAPTLIAAAQQISRQSDDLCVVILPAPSVRTQVETLANSWTGKGLIITDASDAPEDVMASMDVALACSGTVTTELAEQGAAVVTGYKLGWLSWAIARLFLIRTRFISLLNVAANRMIMPEFVQTKLTKENVRNCAERLLTNSEQRHQQVRDQNAAIVALAGGRAGETASRSADAVLQLASSATADRTGVSPI